jgi:hypothetical protein
MSPSRRRTRANPPLHARNLFRMSVAVWDAWFVDLVRGRDAPAVSLRPA